MSVIDQSDLRPARVTPRLALPVPGDAGPADYVTDTGRLADRLDIVVRSPVVTELPANPADGDECYFVAAATDPRARMLWHLRYNAAARHWEFLGGPPFYSESLTGALVTSPGYSRDWTPPRIIIALPGVYLVRFGANMNFHGSAGQYGLANCVLHALPAGEETPGVTDAYLDNAASVVGTGASGGGGAVAAAVRDWFEAGRGLGLIFNATNQEANLAMRWIEVTPIGGFS